MKKIFLAVLAVSLVTGAALAIDGGGKKRSKKAKTECGRNCPDSKDCHKTAKCPNKPGCICN